MDERRIAMEEDRFLKELEDQSISFSDELKSAIQNVSSAMLDDIANELGDDAANAEVVAEITLDADRLLTFGKGDAHKELMELIERHGFQKVRKMAERYVTLA